MISHPSESCEEGEVVACIKAEMESLGYDEVKVDGLGNVMGFMGEGDKIIAIDSHIDTVGIGNIDNWDADPYEGYETDEIIYGRGGSDQEGGMASATYAAKMMKDMGLIPEGYKIMVVGTVQEEDCDGMCWQYIYNKDGIKPEFVISTEPTDGGIYRGHRGRMEIRVDVHGTSCHGSAPDRGDNAIYKMADIIADVRALNNNGCDESTDIKGLVKMLDPKYNPEHFEDARFLGRGTCTVSQIFYTSPSRCAVADSCAISIDRRMTAGETWESCLDEIRNLPAAKKYGDDVKVSMYMYDRPSWTGEVYETEAYFPTWINKETAPHVKALVDAHKAMFGDERHRLRAQHGQAHRSSAVRQVDLLHELRLHPGPLWHPLRGLWPGCRVSGTRSQRGHLQGRPGHRCRHVRGCPEPLRSEPGRWRCHRVPRRSDQQQDRLVPFLDLVEPGAVYAPGASC